MGAVHALPGSEDLSSRAQLGGGGLAPPPGPEAGGAGGVGPPPLEEPRGGLTRLSPPLGFHPLDPQLGGGIQPQTPKNFPGGRGKISIRRM